MYIWNITELARDIKRRQLSEDEKVKYYIAYSILIVFAFGVGTILPFDTSPQMSLLVLLSNVAITSGGIVLAFQENKKFDNIDFIERSVILGLPILIRVSVFILTFNIIFVLLKKNGVPVDFINNSIFQFLFSVSLVSLFFFFLYNSFSKLSHIQATPKVFFPKSDDIEKEEVFEEEAEYQEEVAEESTETNKG